MKKSKAIHLILITSSLASCARVLEPSYANPRALPDASLTQEPDYYPVTCSSPCAPCRLQESDQWNAAFHSSVYIPSFGGSSLYYYHGKEAMHIASYAHKVVVRGGWGSNGALATSGS